MTPQPIRFHHRGRLVELAEVPPTRTVLDWLREDAHCVGTKEGCNEGDCGACTVVVGELAEDGEALQLQTMNACLQFLPTLDGKALFTVEALKALGEVHEVQELHPVQQAMVDCHGSQCGFCTPGFVMSLWSAYERHNACGTRPDRQALADEVAGNLCRCTGYRPILDAGQRMFAAPPRMLDRAPVIAALRSLRREQGMHHTAHGVHFHAPASLRDLATLQELHPRARLLAGGTDIGVWVNKQFRDLGEHLIFVGGVKELRRIGEKDGELLIGAAASLERAWQALAQRSPHLIEMWKRFASPPIRHAGTMGGNVANGSPIGDCAPVLMALDTALVLRKGVHVRRVSLESFYLGYMKNDLHDGEFVEAIAVPLEAFNRTLRAYKISKRFDSDISAVCAGLSIELDGETVSDVRLVFGGMAATVKRAAHAEAALLGKPWSEASIHAAQAALAQDFQPLSDMRASAAYRMQVAQNLLMRFWMETRAADQLSGPLSRVSGRGLG